MFNTLLESFFQGLQLFLWEISNKSWNMEVIIFQIGGIHKILVSKLLLETFLLGGLGKNCNLDVT